MLYQEFFAFLPDLLYTTFLRASKPCQAAFLRATRLRKGKSNGGNVSVLDRIHGAAKVARRLCYAKSTNAGIV